MAKVNTGGYSITTVSEDLSAVPYCPPSIDPRLVQRLMKGNASGGEYAYVTPTGKVKARRYLENSKLTPTEYKVKQMLDLGMGVLDEPVTDLIPGEDKLLILGKTAPTVGETADVLSSRSGTLSQGQILKAMKGLITKGYITVTK